MFVTFRGLASIAKDITDTHPACQCALQQPRIMTTTLALSVKFTRAVSVVVTAWRPAHTMYAYLTGGILSGLMEWKNH
jgi:hypothetical protein